MGIGVPFAQPGLLDNGHAAGAIENFARITEPSAPDAGVPSTIIFGFRCVMEELLSLTKERAQIAMLQFALIGQVFAPPPSANPGAISNAPGRNFLAFLPILQQWAHGATPARPARQALITELGEEFATAVQLHIAASQELAELISRSGAAHLPHLEHHAQRVPWRR